MLTAAGRPDIHRVPRAPPTTTQHHTHARTALATAPGLAQWSLTDSGATRPLDNGSARASHRTRLASHAYRNGPSPLLRGPAPLPVGAHPGRVLPGSYGLDLAQVTRVCEASIAMSIAHCWPNSMPSSCAQRVDTPPHPRHSTYRTKDRHLAWASCGRTNTSSVICANLAPRNRPTVSTGRATSRCNAMRGSGGWGTGTPIHEYLSLS